MNIAREQNGNGIGLYDDSGRILRIPLHVELETWSGRLGDEPVRRFFPCEERHDGSALTLAASVDDNAIGKLTVSDTYGAEDGLVVLKRELTVEQAKEEAGVRLWLRAELLPDQYPRFADCSYFAPPALYDKNDLDGDGYEDYFRTQNLVYREDRFNYPQFLAYHAPTNRCVLLKRHRLPAFDSRPGREAGQTAFLQKTDIGSLGVWTNGSGVDLAACYPFYEAEATIGLYIAKTVPFGAFWPLETGERLQVAYAFSAYREKDFHAALWRSITDILDSGTVQADRLPCPAEELTAYRLSALNRYYVEKEASEDPLRPAGYVMNCHPQDGVQLENIIQYGFTGQNLLNAYNVLRSGYATDNGTYVRRAVRIADFFVSSIRIPSSGMFYNLYNADTGNVDFWWTGLLLPLAYAQGEELQSLMGPLYEYRKPVIDTLRTLKGAYLRCMNEDVKSLISLYRLEREHGCDHETWREAIFAYGRFLVKVQNDDGSYHRAYTLDGKPMVKPKFWFGTTLCERASSTGTAIVVLVDLYRLSGDSRFLSCAVRAGDFVKEHIIEKIKFNGGVHDSIYAKGQLIDNEGILYPMFGMLDLYEQTKEERFLDAAVKAGRLFASWVCLWKVPLPADSTLEKYHFNSTGMGACDTCGAGYVHPFQLMGVAELARIAVYAKDRHLFRIAQLYWQGCNQTVSLPGRDWGYASYGLQEEGYLLSWWAVDDPMFSGDTGFGNRLKGEGNKTCFPWIPAVAVKAYWSLIDTFGTADFETVTWENAVSGT